MPRSPCPQAAARASQMAGGPLKGRPPVCKGCGAPCPTFSATSSPFFGILHPPPRGLCWVIINPQPLGVSPTKLTPPGKPVPRGVQAIRALPSLWRGTFSQETSGREREEGRAGGNAPTQSHSEVPLCSRLAASRAPALRQHTAAWVALRLLGPQRTPRTPALRLTHPLQSFPGTHSEDWEAEILKEGPLIAPKDGRHWRAQLAWAHSEKTAHRESRRFYSMRRNGIKLIKREDKQNAV